MTLERGYYSLVQYCPNLARMESACIGALLFCPGAGFLDIRMSPTNRRVKRFFRAEVDLHHVRLAKDSFVGRIRKERSRIATLADLEHFIATRANDVLLTSPRIVMVESPKATLDELYEELVKESAEEQDGAVPGVVEVLKHRFTEPRFANRVQFDRRLPIPNKDGELRIPFSFLNGAAHHILPETYTCDRNGQNRASMRAYDGYVLRKHAGKRGDRLVVIPVLKAPPAEAASFEEKLISIFRDVDVTVYKQSQVDALVEWVDREARELDSAE